MCCLELILAGCLTASISYSISINKQLKKAWTNPNFGCYTRAAAEVLGNRFIKKERRRVASGDIVMLCVDVAGMGTANSKYGELVVNANMKSALNQISAWRGVRLISQLNSGDEFILLVDKVDVDGILKKIDSTFKYFDFDGAYSASCLIQGDFITSANEGMKLVYEIKKSTKC